MATIIATDNVQIDSLLPKRFETCWRGHKIIESNGQNEPFTQSAAEMMPTMMKV